MKRIWTAKIPVLGVCLFLIWGGMVSAAGFTLITKEELKVQQDKGDIIILDVRPKMSWFLSGSKIKGALREDPTGVDSWQGKYAKDNMIVLYCQTDVTSSGVARQLASAGFQRVQVLRGGWSAWSDAGYPTEKK